MPLRRYDPAIARWTSIDPVTHHWQSTYSAFDGNPVFWTDPSGASVEQTDNGTTYTGEDAKVAFLNLRNEHSDSGGTDPKKKKKKSQKKDVKNMGTGELYGMAYNGGSRTAFLNGNDPYNPTDADIAQNEREKADAAGELILFVAGEWAFAKVLQGSSYVYRFVKFKRVFNSTMRSSVKDKLARYLLNLSHPVGGSKAKFFKETLGFTLENADDLAKQIVFNNKRAIATEVTKYGTKYSQNIAVKGANGRVVDVTFGWIKDAEGLVKLVTGYPK